MPSANDLLDIAQRAAERAGAYLRTAPSQRDPAGWTAKGRADWVTEVDRTAEGLIRDVLLASAPGSQIIGEELSPELVTGDLVWIVDPLDGTTNFLHSYPCFAVSIAAAIHGRLEAAVVLHVPLNRLTTATRGGGTWEDGRQTRVSAIEDPAHALIGTGVPYNDFTRMERYLDQLGRVTRSVTGIRRPGSAAIDLADVAAGRFDGFWEQRLSAWDIAAGILLVTEAGGRGHGRPWPGPGHRARECGRRECRNPSLAASDFAGGCGMTESIEQFAQRVAGPTPVPAGGSVAAITAGLAAALPAMIGRIGLAKGMAVNPASFSQMVEQSERLSARLLALGYEDADAYLAVIEARRNHAGGEAERDARISQAWRRAAHAPAEVIRLSREVAQLGRRAAKEGPPSTVGDALMATLLAAAAAAGAMVNLRLNVQAAGRPVDLRLLEDDMTVILREAQRAAMETRQLVEQRLAPASAI